MNIVNNNIYILDGYSWFHRFYHGSKRDFLKNSEGLATNGLRSFKKMLDELIATQNIKYFFVALDSDSQKFRTTLYPEYKVGRSPTEEELKEQLAFLPEFLEEYGIMYAELESFEADDIIGSLTSQFAEENKIILSNDGDMVQLIDENTKVTKTNKWITDLETISESSFELKNGYAVTQVVDFKALAGDAGDNIKGVPQIGPVAAKKLLKKFGSIENIYVNINDVTERQQNLLLEGQNSCRLSYQLATIYKGLRFDLTIDDLKIEHDRESFNKYFEELVK